MMKLVAVLVACAASVGCAANFDRAAMRLDLQQDRRIVFDDEDVLRISQLKPQIQYPMRLAVVPPERGDLDEVLAIGEQLKKEGIVSTFSVIPSILLDGMGSIKSIRIAAARMQADAVLILRSITEVESTVNPLGLLDVTLVGMFLVPGHQKEALTMVEGMVIDNRNQFLYFAAGAEGLGSTMGPLAVIEERDAIVESRRNALRAFGEMLVKEARQAKAFVPGPRYETPK